MSAPGSTHRAWEWGVLVALLLLAFWFRTYRLDDVPPGLHHDDIKNILLVTKIVQGDVRIYYYENYGHEPLYHWLQALYLVMIGTPDGTGSYPQIRLLSVGISMVGLATAYALAKRLLGHRVALWTLAWQATSLWTLFYSRRAIRGILLPPLAALTGYLFLTGLAPKKRGWFSSWGTWIAGGSSLAACLHTYMGSRVLPLFFVLLVLYLGWFDRSRLRACWRGIVLFFAVALILSLPLGAYLLSHPEERMSQIGGPLLSLVQGDWQPLLKNSLRALGMFTFIGDPHWRQYVANTPVFEPLGAILFYAGIALSLWRWRKIEYAFSLLWLPVTLAPAMLSEGAPNFLRPIAVQTTLYILPALATSTILQTVQRHKRPLKWIVVTVSIGLLVWNAWLTIDGYFVRWPQHPDARFAYNSTLLDESRYLDAATELDSIVLSGHLAADLDPAMIDSFLQRTDLIPRWCDVRQSLVFPNGDSTLVLQPDYFPIDPTLAALFLDEQVPVYEHHLQDGTFVFAAYSLQAKLLNDRLAAAQQYRASWSAATTFPDGFAQDMTELDWPVQFSEQVAWIGYEILNQDPVSPRDMITMVTYWRVTQPASPTGSIFVHLLSPEGTVLSGFDGFGAPPNRWIGGDILVQIHRFDIPADTSPGVYPIELGWYEKDTGTRWTVSLPTGTQVERLLVQPLTVSQGAN